ncbi:cytochrome C [Poseidonibacter lekithochrous]|uniref:cytochrome C n=1 Tax=Poseidonibacter lekithochrous TaxID=1904463 RepID=UPI00196AF046|nr:cytochrome C [Poseidonibacter lekithochrous]
MKSLFILILLINILNANYQELLFNGNCITCHNTNNNNKSAPTIIEIQNKYKEAFPNKKDFIYYMSTWVYKPNEINSIMKDSIELYNLMPNLAYDKTTLEDISEYIYNKDFNIK